MLGIVFVCFCVSYVGNWVCLFVCWGIMLGIAFVCFCVSYVGNWVCLFVGALMFGNGCVIWNKHS